MKQIKILLIIALSVFLIYAVFAKKSYVGKKFHSKHFEHLDKDKDDKISKDEWITKFDSIDSDKSGSITKEEMKKYHKARKKKCRH